MGEQVGKPSDVFSLGAILAFASTGNGPFGTGQTPALLYRVVKEQPDLTRVPDQVRPLIEQCLAKDPASRPTPADLLTSLSDDVAAMTGSGCRRRSRTRWAGTAPRSPPRCRLRSGNRIRSRPGRE